MFRLLPSLGAKCSKIEARCEPLAENERSAVNSADLL